MHKKNIISTLLHHTHPDQTQASLVPPSPANYFSLYRSTLYLSKIKCEFRLGLAYFGLPNVNTVDQFRTQYPDVGYFLLRWCCCCFDGFDVDFPSRGVSFEFGADRISNSNEIN